MARTHLSTIDGQGTSFCAQFQVSRTTRWALLTDLWLRLHVSSILSQGSVILEYAQKSTAAFSKESVYDNWMLHHDSDHASTFTVEIIFELCAEQSKTLFSKTIATFIRAELHYVYSKS